MEGHLCVEKTGRHIYFLSIKLVVLRSVEKKMWYCGRVKMVTWMGAPSFTYIKTRPDTRLLKLRAGGQVTRPFGQEQWGQRNKIIKKSKVWRTIDQPTDRPMDKAGCTVACTRLKTTKKCILFLKLVLLFLDDQQFSNMQKKCHFV